MKVLDKVRFVPYANSTCSKKQKFIVEFIENDIYSFCKNYENESINSNQLVIDKAPPRKNCIYSKETDSWHSAFGANFDGTINLRPKNLSDLRKVFWKPTDYPPSKYHVFDFQKDCWILPTKSFFSSKGEKDRRLEICNNCEYYSRLKICICCGCFIPAKSKIKMFSCPIGKW